MYEPTKVKPSVSSGDVYINPLAPAETVVIKSVATDLMTTVSAGANGFMYTSPELTEGLTLVGSYMPQGSNAESGMGIGANYTGMEGLTLNYATQDVVGGSAGARGDLDLL